MAQAHNFLDRFRPAGAPGAAGRAGVPADRRRELAAEIEPVLALLDAAYAECGQIEAAASREVSVILERARAEAARIGAEAERSGRSASAQAVERALSEAGQQARQATAAARRDAAAVRALAEIRTPGLVARAVELARTGPGGPSGPLAAGPPGPPAAGPPGGLAEGQR